MTPLPIGQINMIQSEELTRKNRVKIVTLSQTPPINFYLSEKVANPLEAVIIPVMVEGLRCEKYLDGWSSLHIMFKHCFNKMPI